MLSVGGHWGCKVLGSLEKWLRNVRLHFSICLAKYGTFKSDPSTLFHSLKSKHIAKRTFHIKKRLSHSLLFLSQCCETSQGSGGQTHHEVFHSVLHKDSEAHTIWEKPTVSGEELKMSGPSPRQVNSGWGDFEQGMRL